MMYNFFRRQENKLLIKLDLKELRRLREPFDADESEDIVAWTKVAIRRAQMSLALHRKGLVSPFDYEYPRLKNMSKLAQLIYDRHVAPVDAEFRAVLAKGDEE